MTVARPAISQTWTCRGSTPRGRSRRSCTAATLVTAGSFAMAVLLAALEGQLLLTDRQIPASRILGTT